MLSNRTLFQKHLAQTSDAPLALEIEYAEGIYLLGTDKKKYIDLISGISVSNVGHRHPKVVKAIKDQLDHYMHLMVYGELVQAPQNQLALKLLQTLPEKMDNIYLVNSGSEAIEGAIKLAKRYTGRSQLLSCLNAYHGSTHGALSLGGNEYLKQAYRPLLPDVRHIEFGNFEQLNEINEQTAAVFIEIVQGEAGVQTASKEYFQLLRNICDAKGTLLVVDEIQTGFGRTGKFWAFEHYDLVPDIVVCAKGMGGGMPIGAFIASQQVMEVLKNNPVLGHITTFGGHPVSCAASLATIEIIEEENLLADVEKKADLFKQLLKHPKIKNIRNKGLIMAVEFEDDQILKKIIDNAIRFGVLTDWFLYCSSAMRIAPPLIISHKEIEEACLKLLEAIEAV